VVRLVVGGDDAVDKAFEIMQRDEDGVGEALSVAQAFQQQWGRVETGGGRRRRRRPPADLLQIVGGSPEQLRPREGVGEEAAGARHLVPREVHEPRPVVAAAPVPPGGAVETRPPPGVDGRVQVVLDGA